MSWNGDACGATRNLQVGINGGSQRTQVRVQNSSTFINFQPDITLPQANLLDFHHH